MSQFIWKKVVELNSMYLRKSDMDLGLDLDPDPYPIFNSPNGQSLLLIDF